MRKIIFMLCFVFGSGYCFGQQNFLELDTISYVGVKINNQNAKKNALKCQWQKSKNEIIELTPYQVRSYAAGGNAYIAKDIAINGKEGRFFLERQSFGKLTLYFIKNQGKHFFVERAGVLSELTKRDSTGRKDYKKILQTLCSDCDYTGKFLKHTWYNRYYLKRFAEQYNTCEEVYRPVRFGVIGGWDFTGYSMLQDAWKSNNVPTCNGFTFGAFLDIPLLQSGVSFHPEIFYSKQAIRLTETLQTVLGKECIANIESYNIPLLIRYTWWKNKWCPYLNLGMIYHHYSRTTNSILSASIGSGVLNIQKNELALSPSKYSATGGVGVWYKIGRRNAIFIETRAAYNMDRYTYNIFTGINF